MYVGAGNLCLRVGDLDRAIRFYQQLGLEVVPDAGVPGASVYVRRGNLSIFLMGNFGSDSLNFRGADAFDVHDHLCANGFEPTRKPNRQKDGGSNWLIEDPDGHPIFFNTHQHETTAAHRAAKVQELLRNTEQDLIDLGADEACLRVYREQILERFARS